MKYSSTYQGENYHPKHFPDGLSRAKLGVSDKYIIQYNPRVISFDSNLKLAINLKSEVNTDKLTAP
jgi:hypothetical protein